MNLTFPDSFSFLFEKILKVEDPNGAVKFELITLFKSWMPENFKICIFISLFFSLLRKIVRDYPISEYVPLSEFLEIWTLILFRL